MNDHYVFCSEEVMHQMEYEFIQYETAVMRLYYKLSATITFYRNKWRLAAIAINKSTQDINYRT